MSLTSVQKRKMRKFLDELKSKRRRHTELISVYIPKDYEISKVIGQLADEQGTASNIKSTSTRKNVEDALERMIQHLRMYTRTPEHGIAVFSGNVSDREGQSDVQVYSFEPPEALNLRLYRCDKEFVTEPLEAMLDTDNIYGLIVMDRRDATIAELKGKTITKLLRTHSEVPGKFKAGGQCLHPDTLVQLSDGRIERIEDVMIGDTAIGMSIPKTKPAQALVYQKWETAQPTLHITTKHPRIDIVASEDHRFFVNRSGTFEEVEASDLHIDDELIIPKRMRTRSRIHDLNPKRYANSYATDGAFLKKQRIALRLTQREIAQRTGLTQTSISSYETERLMMHRERIGAVASALEIEQKQLAKTLTEQTTLPNTLIPAFARILGYLTGDGSIEEDRISFFESREEVAKAYAHLIEETLSITPTMRYRETKRYHQIRVASRPLVRLIHDSFPQINSARTSTIPELVLTGSDEVLAGYLRGFFDAEGYGRPNRIGLGINNERLSAQIQLALFRLGIIASRTPYDNRKNPYSSNTRWTIEISDQESLRVFARRIGFTAHDKNAVLERIAERKAKSHSRRIAFDGRMVRAIIEANGGRVSDYPCVSNFFNGKRRMSIDTFERSVYAVSCEPVKRALEKLMRFEYLPVRISSIKPRGVERLIDISTTSESFIAQGLVVHNSAQRFARLREGAAKDHYKKVAEYTKEQFLNREGLKGIIVGGPGPTKYEFVDGNYITDQVKQKIIGIKDLSYTDEFGLQELVDKSEDILAEEEIQHEKDMLNRFFGYLATKPGMVAYGKNDVKNRLEMGVVDTLIISESTDDALIEEFSAIAEQFGSTVMLTSPETREGNQLDQIGKVAAILRYEVQD